MEQPEVGAAVNVDGDQFVVLVPFPDVSDDQRWLTPEAALKLADELRETAISMLSPTN